MDKNQKVRAHIVISGFVQGVFFRENTRQRAQALSVFGWVKNLPDGKVEAVFEGEKENVEKLVDWAKKGPDSARVDSVDIKWEEYKGEFNSFKVRHW